MKKIILSFLLAGILPHFVFSQNNISIGANLVNRSFSGTYKSYNYPRLSCEYRFTKCSSVELLTEYINLKKSHNIDVISYPISVGYKLNYVPLFTKNKWFVNNFKIYNSFRYSMILTNKKNNTVHKLTYSPGIDIYVYKNLGINGEIVFGKAMKTTLAVGLKLRLK